MISGALTSEEVAKLKNHCINPVDSREASEEIPQTLNMVHPEPEDVKILEGFSKMNEKDLKALYDSFGLAMTFKDFLHIQKYFHDEEKRDPSMTEIRVLIHTGLIIAVIQPSRQS